MTSSLSIVELGQGVFSFHPVERGFGYTNAGLVIGSDGHTVVDSGPTPHAGALLRGEIEGLTAQLELPFRRVTLSSSRVYFSGGARAFAAAAIFTSDPTSDELDAPINRDALAALLPRWAATYRDEEFRTRPATHTITIEAWLNESTRGFTLPGEATANLVVEVPAANVVFAGALCSFGVTPLCFDGDPAAWAQSLRTLSSFNGVIVPGHGPPGSSEDAAVLADYFDACIRADGDPHHLDSGPWEEWTDRGFDAVNTERAARLQRGDRSIPTAMFDLLGWT